MRGVSSMPFMGGSQSGQWHNAYSNLCSASLETGVAVSVLCRSPFSGLRLRLNDSITKTRKYN